MLGLENHPLYLMRNHFIHTLNAKKRAFDEDLNLQPERKVQRTMSTSSPQEPKNQVNHLLVIRITQNEGQASIITLFILSHFYPYVVRSVFIFVGRECVYVCVVIVRSYTISLIGHAL